MWKNFGIAMEKETKPRKGASASAEGPGGRMKPSEQIDQYIAGIADWRGKVLATIRRIMLEADPAVTEDWKWMGTPVWYCDGMVSLANPHGGKVKWTFVKGAHFADADHLFNAALEGNDWRAIDIFEKDRPNESALRRLVKTAIAYNRPQLKGKKASDPAPKAARRPGPRRRRSAREGPGRSLTGRLSLNWAEMGKFSFTPTRLFGLYAAKLSEPDFRRVPACHRQLAAPISSSPDPRVAAALLYAVSRRPLEPARV